jgi:hypothetical protein
MTFQVLHELAWHSSKFSHSRTHTHSNIPFFTHNELYKESRLFWSIWRSMASFAVTCRKQPNRIHWSLATQEESTVCIWWSFPPFFAFMDSCYGPMGGGPGPCEVMAKKNYAVMDLMSICRSHCLIPHSVISSFGVAPRGFYSKAYYKGLHSEIFQSWNNECIK